MKKGFFKIIIIVMIINLLSFTATPHVYASKNTKHPVIKYYVTSDFAPVRCGPNKHAPKIAELGKRMIVNVRQVLHFRGTKKSNRWAKFKFNGYTAYISLKHLSKKPPTS